MKAARPRNRMAGERCSRFQPFASLRERRMRSPCCAARAASRQVAAASSFRTIARVSQAHWGRIMSAWTYRSSDGRAAR
jgi:hypothetical protein